jgi:pyruvate dehydrogenase E1 component
MLADKYGVAADVWSVTSYKTLRQDALDTERWNLLHPSQKPRRNYLEQVLANESGVFVAVSDYMRSVPEMIARWVPGGLLPLGTDGFGRSENRSSLRRFFEVDGECITVASLYRLLQLGEIKGDRVAQAIRDLGLNPEQANPMHA